MRFEYKVIPAPTKGIKARGVKGSAGRFANGLEAAINELAADNWVYVRAETLPAEEREGLMSKTTVFQNVLVFKRPVSAEDPAPVPVEEVVDDPHEEPASEDALSEESSSEPDVHAETSETDTDDRPA